MPSITYKELRGPKKNRFRDIIQFTCHAECAKKKAKASGETFASICMREMPLVKHQGEMPIAVNVVVKTGVEIVDSVQVPDTPDATAVAAVVIE